jgi:hypothetical protein
VAARARGKRKWRVAVYEIQGNEDILELNKVVFIKEYCAQRQLIVHHIIILWYVNFNSIKRTLENKSMQ